MPRPVEFNRAAASFRAVLRLDARRLTPQEFARWDGREPVILTNAAQGPFAPDASDEDVARQRDDAEGAWAFWRHRLAQDQKERALPYRRRLPDGTRETAWTRLDDFMQVVDEARQRAPEPGLLAMEELVLNSERALRPGPLAPVLEGEDFFQSSMPEEWRPPKFCLVLGTSGARSALHTDPFGWTGWNLLLSGRKLWRFVVASEQAEQSLYVERPQQTNLAAHGESPVDLFATAEVPAGGVPAERQGAIPGWAVGGPDLERFPRAAEAEVAYEVEQQAGEAIVFPASWWHQTLHLTPTLSVASQYVNENCARQVLDGIARRAELPEEALGAEWRAQPWPQQIASLVEALEASGWVRRRGGV